MNNNKLKYIFLFISVLILSISIQAQDLIVTNEGDSLNCKITKITSENIYFTFKHKEEIRGTFLPLWQVKFHKYNFYKVQEVPSDKVVENEAYPHMRFAINGGWSYRMAKISDNIPSEFEKYMKDLKSGYHYGCDLSFYFSEQLGFGFKYNHYQSKNELENVTFTFQDGSTRSGLMSDDISINFIGPFFSTRLLDASKKNSFLLNLGIGYMGYTDNAVLVSDLTIEGNTVGICWDMGYDIAISKNLSLGFQVSYLMGTLTQYEVTQGMDVETVKLEKDNYESLSRLDVSMGLRISL
jgi:hypothetical protein